MRKYKKIISVMAIGAMALSMVAGCSKKTSDNYTVGIGQFAQHGSLDNCREGFIEGLKEEGIEEKKNLKILSDNANADTGVAGQIANNYVSQKVDLICGIATPMAQSAYGAAANSNIPVVYTAVSSPIMAQLANEDGTPAGNVTGTSDELPVADQLKMIRAVLPDAKKIGIMYTSSEVNSEATIKAYQELVGEYGFELELSAISTTADIPLAADTLISKVDCISNITDNTVVSSLPVILAKAKDANIPVFGSEVEQVKIGCLAAVGLDYYQLGIQTGKMAAQILKGEKKASDMKFETITEGSFYGNTAVADQLNITLPADYVDKAAEMFDSIS